MEKENKKNRNILLKGLIISVLPILVLRLEVFIGSNSKEFLISMLYKVISEIIIVGVIGIILSWIYIILKKKYLNISKIIIRCIILIYYLLALIYFIAIIFFRTQAPLIS